MNNNIGFVSLVLIGNLAFAQTAVTTTAAPATPMEVCKAIVDSAKNKDYESIRKMSTGMKPDRPNATKNKRFAEMEQKFYTHFETLTCGQSLVTDQHAVIETDTQTDKRLIPFVKVGSTWKFDSETYRVFYDTRDQIKK